MKWYMLGIYWFIGYFLLLREVYKAEGIRLNHLIAGAILAFAWPIGVMWYFEDKILFKKVL